MMLLKRDMQTVKAVWKFAEGIFGSLWVLTVLDYFSVVKLLQFTFQDTINSIFQSIYIAVGLVYFIANGIYRHQKNALDREAQAIQNRKNLVEVEMMEYEAKKN